LGCFFITMSPAHRHSARERAIELLMHKFG
jgi:hypothetical protein